MTQTLNETPTGSRLHIAIFGRRNAGKSSLINALTNQQAAIVSEVAGTTTDPVRKSMEILPIGPVVIIDTAGIDDTGPLGEARIAAHAARARTDRPRAAGARSDGRAPMATRRTWRSASEREGVPLVAVVNKIDIHPDDGEMVAWAREGNLPVASVSAVTREGIEQLKQTMIRARAAILGGAEHSGRPDPAWRYGGDVHSHR